MINEALLKRVRQRVFNSKNLSISKKKEIRGLGIEVSQKDIEYKEELLEKEISDIIGEDILELIEKGIISEEEGHLRAAAFSREIIIGKRFSDVFDKEFSGRVNYDTSSEFVSEMTSGKIDLQAIFGFSTEELNTETINVIDEISKKAKKTKSGIKFNLDNNKYFEPEEEEYLYSLDFSSYWPYIIIHFYSNSKYLIKDLDLYKEIYDYKINSNKNTNNVKNILNAVFGNLEKEARDQIVAIGNCLMIDVLRSLIIQHNSKILHVNNDGIIFSSKFTKEEIEEAVLKTVEACYSLFSENITAQRKKMFELPKIKIEKINKVYIKNINNLSYMTENLDFVKRGVFYDKWNNGRDNSFQVLKKINNLLVIDNESVSKENNKSDFHREIIKTYIDQISTAEDLMEFVGYVYCDEDDVINISDKDKFGNYNASIVRYLPVKKHGKKLIRICTLKDIREVICESCIILDINYTKKEIEKIISIFKLHADYDFYTNNRINIIKEDE